MTWNLLVIIGDRMQFERWTALQPSEKGRPDLQVLNVPERTQVDDGAPWHGARGARGPGRPRETFPLPSPSLQLPHWQSALVQAELQTPDGLHALELVTQEPHPLPRKVQHPGRAGWGGEGPGVVLAATLPASRPPGPGRQRRSLTHGSRRIGPVGSCSSVTYLKVQFVFQIYVLEIVIFIFLKYGVSFNNMFYCRKFGEGD